MPMPDLRNAASALAFSVALAVAGCSDPPRHAALPPDATVLALGDSLPYGTGATPDTSYPSMLALETGWRVVNAGVPGETAAQGCTRLPALLDEHAPQLVLVLLGGNDFLRRLPEQGVTSALSECVEAARAKRIAIALIPVPRFGTTGFVNSTLYVDAGEAWEVPVVDAALGTLLAQPAMRADRVHLNAAGYRSMALTIAEGLRVRGWLAPLTLLLSERRPRPHSGRRRKVLLPST